MVRVQHATSNDKIKSAAPTSSLEGSLVGSREVDRCSYEEGPLF